MRILLSWLRDFVQVPVGASELGEMLSMRGFEIAAIEEPPPGPLAPVPAAATPGQPAFVLGASPLGPGRSTPVDAGRSLQRAAEPDAVLDIEVTANRPDCLSVYGIAREVATAYGLPLAPIPEADRSRHAGAGDQSWHGASPLCEGASGQVEGLTLVIEDPELCPRYAAGRAAVKVGPSPEWLANRLLAGGVRPINNVVDVSNYVLLELGHPTHAFDFERLGGRELRVRRARAGEQITTLDGVRRTVDADMLVIADASRPQAIAGVMGGADSDVHAGTRSIAFESAFFKPSSVRRTSRRLGLRSEASYRFERGADIEAPLAALARAWSWLSFIGAGAPLAPILDCYPLRREPVTVTLREGRLAALLGQPIEAEAVVRILTELGFDVRVVLGGWLVGVPSWRVDVVHEADLIEEVARHYGYDRLPTTFPPLVTFPPREDPRLERDRTVRRVLSSSGFTEAQTLTFIEAAAAEPFASGPLVALANPLSEKFAVLRPSLVPGLAASIGLNRRHQRPDVRLFEIGARFSTAEGEQATAAMAWTGAAAAEHWSRTGRAVDFFDMKGAAERLLEALRVAVTWDPQAPAYLVEGCSASMVAGGTVLGVAGQLRPELAETHGLPAADPVFVAEIDLERIPLAAGTAEVHVEPLPRFPPIVRDLSVTVDETLPAETVRGTIVAAAPSTLTAVHEFDRYRGPGIPEGRVSLSFRLTFRAADRTLTDAEADRAMDAVVARLAERHQAVRR